MNNKNSQQLISTRQFMLLFFLMILSPTIRFPKWVASIGAQAGWLAPVITLGALILLMYMMFTMFRKQPGRNLFDIISAVMTRPVAVVVAIIFSVWLTFLAGYYIRTYAERIVATIFANTSIEFIILALLALIWFVLRAEIATMARMNELLVYFILAAFFLTTTLAIANKVKIENLLPISHLDMMPLLSTSARGLSLWSSVFVLFFFFDRVNHQNDLMRYSVRSGILLTVVTVMILMVTIGTLGYPATLKVNLPYFTVIKNASIFDALEHFEAIILLMWVVADYAMVSVLAYSVGALQQSVFKLPTKRVLFTPILLIVYGISLIIAPNTFLMEAFSSDMGLSINLAFCVAFPVVLFGIGKIRRVF